MKKVLALVLSVVLLCSVFPLQVFARDIKDFQFFPKKTKYYHGVDGHYDEENPDNFIFEVYFAPGDIVRLTDFDNLDTDYTCVRNEQTGELEFCAENGDVIALDELKITTEQEDGGEWNYSEDGENLHYFSVELEGNEASVQIQVMQNPVQYISYEPNGEQHRLFESEGEWKTDEEGELYFHYALEFVREGDALCVGTDEYEYYYIATWSEEEQQLYFQPTREDADPLFIGPDGIEFEDNQAEQHFSVGADNYYTVRYMGQSFPIQVVIDEPGMSVSYTPKEPIVAYLNTNGVWETDAGGNEYFRYFGTIRTQDGDILTLTDSEGESTDYIARWNTQRDCREYVSAGGSVINGDDIRFIDEQYQTHYTLGSENYFYIEFRGMRAAVQVTVTENPVSAIAFIPAREKVIIENSGGSWETDPQGQEWYNYSIPGFEEGDVLDVTYTDSGETVRYTYNTQTYCSGFFDSEGNPLAEEDNIYLTRSGRWDLGDDNYYKVVYFERESDPLAVSIVPSPIGAIEYIPAQPKVCYYETGGEWDTDDAGLPYYYYRFTRIESGDILRVTDKQGAITDYTAERDEESYCFVFVSETGETISENDMDIFDDQYREHYELGDDNAYYVEYMGKQAVVPVSVIASPLAAITYVPQQPITLLENIDGYWATDEDGNPYFHYYSHSISSGDQLILTYPDSTTKTYIAQWNYVQEKFYYICGEESVDEDDVEFTDMQYEIPFTVGSDNEIYVTYLGRTCSVQVTVITNPVKAVEFIPAEAATYIENTHGYWVEDESGQHCYFEYFIPPYSTGDIIRITNSDDTVTEYTYCRNDASGYEWFFDEDGNELKDDELHYERDYDVTWEVGAQNEYWINYYGVASNRISVNIVENQVKAIAYAPIKAPVYLEHSDGYWDSEATYFYNLPPMRPGDVLTVTDKNDVATAYTLKQDGNNNRYFQSASGDIIDAEEVRFESRQYDTPWTVGTQNAYMAEYCGVSATLYATVTQNPVKAIDFVPAKPIVIDEGTGGRWILEEHMYLYDPPIFNGDKLVVTYTDDEVVEYVADMDNRTLKAADGREIDFEAVNTYSTQNFRPWLPDEDNSFYLEYAGFSKEIKVAIRERFEVSVVEPTCTQWGYTAHTDPATGNSYHSDYVEALGHSFTLMIANEQTRRSGAESPEGVTYYYTCDRCGALSREENLWFKADTGAVCGRIDLEFYHPVMVDLYQDDTLILGTAVKSDGSFHLSNLAPGTYSAKVRSVNSPLIEITGITVTANIVTDINESEDPLLQNLRIAVGDVNGDGVIDFADMSEILAKGVYGCNWSDERFEERFDLNNDYSIDVEDIAVLLREDNYGAAIKTIEY